MTSMDKATKVKVIKALQRGKSELETHKLAKGEYAKLANCQTPCEVDDKRAACLCMEGALCRGNKVKPWLMYYASGPYKLAAQFLIKAVIENTGDILALETDTCALNEYNDDKKVTKKDVLVRFDDAIALVKKA